VKLIKFASMLVLAGTLVGCGHGFEGEYQSKAGSSNELMNAFAGAVGTQKIVIGSDFIESNGQRAEFNEIFVRESAGTRYLVFKSNDAEEAWKIVDDNTLIQGTGLMNVTLKRIE